MDYTGVPFIDTPQLILCNFLGLDNPLDLSLEMVEDLVLGKKIFGDDSRFATLEWINENFTRFKAASILFGTNHPRSQPSWKKYKNFHKRFYEKYIRMLLEEMHHQYKHKNNNGNTICEICGNSIGNFNFSKKIVSIKSDLYEEYKLKLRAKDKYAYIGRDLFPLVGSMGSEAQIMGNMTKPFIICPRCLFMVNFLLFSAQMIEGKWTLFNIGDLKHLYLLVRSFMKIIIKKIKNTPPDSDFENLGVKKKNKIIPLFNTLFHYFGEISLDFSDPENFLETTQIKDEFISIWKFSNAGQGAELEIQDLPNKFIRFLWLAHALDLQEGIKKILIQEAKNKAHPSKRFYSVISSGRWYPFDKIHKVKGFNIDPYIPLLYGNVVLNIKSDYLEKILKIISCLTQKIEKNKLKEALNDRNFIKLQVLIHSTIEEMIKKGELTYFDLESIFGYIPNSPKLSDTMSLINFLLQLEIDLKIYYEYLENIKDILREKWVDFIDGPINDNNIKNNVIQQEFLRIYLFLGRLLKKKYKDKQKREKFFNREISHLSISWFIKSFSKLSLDYDDFDWNSYQNLFFLGSKITDYYGNYIPNKAKVWYPLRMLLAYYVRSWICEEFDFNEAIQNISNERPKMVHNFINSNMEDFQKLLEVFVYYRFLKRGKKNSIQYFTQVLNGKISEGYFIEQMNSYLEEIAKLENPEYIIGKINIEQFKIKIDKLELLWENCYLDIIDDADGKQNRIFLRLILPNIIRSAITVYNEKTPIVKKKIIE